MTKIRRFYKNELFHEILFLSLAFLCMMIFVFLQPFGEGPDEINRFRVVRFIYENGYLPRGDDPAVLIPGYGGSYAFQPMLTYILEGYLLRTVNLFTDRFDVLLIAARLVNVFFGMAAAVPHQKAFQAAVHGNNDSMAFFPAWWSFLPRAFFCIPISIRIPALSFPSFMFTAVLDGMKTALTVLAVFRRQWALSCVRYPITMPTARCW